jgi:hypothetical protein
MRRVVLAGQRVRVPMPPGTWEEAARFVQRVKAGIGGVSDGGSQLAMQVEDQVVLFTLQLTPSFVQRDRDPTLVIASLEDLEVEASLILLGADRP